MHPLLGTVGGVADGLGVRAWVVGGYVRDLIMGRTDSDLDIMVMGDGIAFARAVAAATGSGPVVAFERFGTAMLPTGAGKVEFVGARKERYDPGSRNPSVAPGTLEEDLLRRDFTVNAIAVSLNRETFGLLEDPLGGRED
ncbi:MAG TPA: tRNA nucleotidyltransferase, partial [Bacteroidota bacterium]|nr:tRNA nucleotidyltransferase [Bacteroidota bacterium]